jgi:hypothetical protein
MKARGAQAGRLSFPAARREHLNHALREPRNATGQRPVLPKQYL